MNIAQKIDLDLERKARAEIDRKTLVISGLVYAGKTVFLRDAGSGGQIAFFNLSNVGKVRQVLSENSGRDCKVFVQRTTEAGEDEVAEFNTPPATVSAPASPPADPEPVAPVTEEAPAEVAPAAKPKPKAAPKVETQEGSPAVEVKAGADDAEVPESHNDNRGDAGGEGDGVDGGDEGEDDEGKIIADEKLKEARRRAKIERQAVLKEFNGRYCIVNDCGLALVFCDEFDTVLQRRIYRRMSPGALKILYLNRRTCTKITDDGQRKLKCVADFWLAHKDRRQHIHGVVFDPASKANDPNVLNLWRGFSVEPKQGSWEKLKNHTRTVICQNNKSHFDYLMGWLARLVQFPAKPGEVAVVLRGELGTGKGTLGHALLALFRQHGMHISSSKHLVGNFNGHLRDCVFLFADEAFFAGDKQNLGVLKALITERVLTIESKHVNAIQAPNMLHVFMSSNSDWVVPAQLGERRYFVLDVSDQHKQDTVYFDAIDQELKNGGYEAMLFDLLRYDLSNFNVRVVPETRALQDQKKQSLDSKFAWWREVLMRGYVYRSKLGLEDHFGRWHDFAATELLFDSYRDFARNERYPISREQLGKFFHELKYAPAKPGTSVVGEHMTPNGAELIHSRKPGFFLGVLDDARQAFEIATGLAVAWENVD